jgi:SAM-dependent methyltransferase
MRRGDHIDWAAAAREAGAGVRPETASKYFTPNPLRRLVVGRFLDALGRALEAFPWNTLLDVGCGEGLVDYYLVRRFPGRGITGVDPDPAALAVARRLNPRCDYREADGRSLPFPDRGFDTAVCLEVLEHLPDYEKVVGELRRVSAGPCLVSVPAWPWYQATNFMIGKNWARRGEHPGHVVRFTRASLHRALARVFPGSVTIRLAYPWLIAVCQ